MCGVEVRIVLNLWMQVTRELSRRKGNSDTGEAAPLTNCAAFLLLAESNLRNVGSSLECMASSCRLLLQLFLNSDSACSSPPLSTGHRILRAENLSCVNVEPNVELSTFIGLFLSSHYTKSPVTLETMDKRELRIARLCFAACEADGLSDSLTGSDPV